MRRLGQVIGRCEAATPAPNVAEKKRTKGASPTAFFRSPSRESGEAHTDLLHDDFLPPLTTAVVHGRTTA